MFIFRFIKWFLVLFVGSSVLAVLVYKWVPVPVTPLMLIRSVEAVNKSESPRWEHRWVPLDSISRHLVTAVVASEDQRFLQHDGFDFTALQEVIEERKSGRRMRGGSTISQQTAKNVFLWPSSTWLRKGLEAYFTVLIELLWSKERIMEVYLNSIEMGTGIYGAEAVARKHFGCAAKDLHRKECALIAATLPNPRRYSSLQPGPYMQKRTRQILREMRNIGDIKFRE